MVLLLSVGAYRHSISNFVVVCYIDLGYILVRRGMPDFL